MDLNIKWEFILILGFGDVTNCDWITLRRVTLWCKTPSAIIALRKPSHTRTTVIWVIIFPIGLWIATCAFISIVFCVTLFASLMTLAFEVDLIQPHSWRAKTLFMNIIILVVTKDTGSVLMTTIAGRITLTPHDEGIEY